MYQCKGKIKKNSGIRSMQAILDSGNNLPVVAISQSAYQALKKAGIIKADMKDTSIKARSADKNKITVLGTVEGEFKLHLGKKHVERVTQFIIIKNL